MSLAQEIRVLAEKKRTEKALLAHDSVASGDGPALVTDEKKDACTISLVSGTKKTLEEVLEAANVDSSIWEVERYVCNKWDQGSKGLVQDGQGFGGSNAVVGVVELWQIKVWLKRKTPEVLSLESLLDQISAKAPVIPKIKRSPVVKARGRRALEVSIFDAHFGLQCFKPSSDLSWSLDECSDMFLWAVDACIEAAKPYMPLEEIVWVFGNDFFHTDNAAGTTTKGTIQPEAVARDEVLLRGEQLAISAVEKLKDIAHVRVYVIPGNHAYSSELLLGRVLSAYYRNDENVTVFADSSPYKFFEWGVNLIGYEHGHSIKPIRLAALMANENPEAWARTFFRAWHLGDQHRRGASSAVVMEEQGCSVEYLPGLTPPNTWHRQKSFNYQKRAATAFVYDYDLGQIAHIQRNLALYTGQPLN